MKEYTQNIKYAEYLKYECIKQVLKLRRKRLRARVERLEVCFMFGLIASMWEV